MNGFLVPPPPLLPFRLATVLSHSKQALEDLDFVWADEEGSGGGGGSGAWACGWVPAAEMADHLERSCPRRSTLCQQGCGQSLVVMEAELHYQNHCPKR